MNDPNCPECKGTGWYIGLLEKSPCKTCGDNRDSLSETSDLYQHIQHGTGWVTSTSTPKWVVSARKLNMSAVATQSFDLHMSTVVKSWAFASDTIYNRVTLVRKVRTALTGVSPGLDLNKVDYLFNGYETTKSVLLECVWRD